MVEGFLDCYYEVDSCEHCAYGKTNCVSLPFGATRAKDIIELIHSDVFGLVLVPSPGVSWYYVSFIDYFSKMTWVYFLRKKSKVFEKFKEFKTLVENQNGKNIMVLGNDNRGELCGKVFDQLCRQHGIARQNTTPYTLQQNGVVERMNRMLMEKSRSMLNGVGKTQEFWAKAIDTMCYLVNRSSSTTLVNKTPYDAWICKKSSLAHLRVFGVMPLCMSQRRKEANSTTSRINVSSLGTMMEVKGYKLWNPITMKTIYSRGVIFREVEGTFKIEDVKREKEPRKLEFELDYEGHDSKKSTKFDEEVEA